MVKMIVVQYSETVAKVADCEQRQKEDDLTITPDSAFYITETGHEHGE